MDIFLQQLVNGLVLGSIYALVALGYTMVYGILGLINFAHGDICMIGALTALAVAQALSAAGVPAPLTLAVALLAALIVCIALGVSIERVAYRPLRRAPRLAPLITAIGVSILLQYSAALVWGKQYLSMPEMVKPTDISFGGAHLTDLQAFIFFVASAVMAALRGFNQASPSGRAMRPAPLITAIGVAILLQYSAAVVWGNQYHPIPEMVKPTDISFGGAPLTDVQSFIFFLACAVMAGLLWFIKSSRMGRAMRATE